MRCGWKNPRPVPKTKVTDKNYKTVRVYEISEPKPRHMSPDEDMAEQPAMQTNADSRANTSKQVNTAAVRNAQNSNQKNHPANGNAKNSNQKNYPANRNAQNSNQKNYPANRNAQNSNQKNHPANGSAQNSNQKNYPANGNAQNSNQKNHPANRNAQSAKQMNTSAYAPLQKPKKLGDIEKTTAIGLGDGMRTGHIDYSSGADRQQGHFQPNGFPAESSAQMHNPAANAPQGASLNEYYAPVPNYGNQGGQQFDELIPKAYRADASKKEKKSGGKVLAVTIVTVLVVLLGVGGFLLFTHFYHNSEDYRVEKAQEAIIDRKEEEALGYIEDFDSERVRAIIEYVDILRTRNKFAEAYKSDQLMSGSDNIKAYCNALAERFEQFSGYDSLPPKLKSKYDTQKKRYEGMKEALANVSEEDFEKAQWGVYKFRDRKRGFKFTIADLESIIDKSEPAINTLEEKLLKTEAYSEFSKNSDSAAVKTMGDFFYNISTQLAQDKFDLSQYSKNTEYNRTSGLFLQDKDTGYQASVADGLKNLQDENDLKENAERLRSSLSYAWMAYVFDVK